MGYSGKTFLPYKWLLFLETLKEDKKLGIHLIILQLFVSHDFNIPKRFLSYSTWDLFYGNK